MRRDIMLEIKVEDVDSKDLEVIGSFIADSIMSNRHLTNEELALIYSGLEASMRKDINRRVDNLQLEIESINSIMRVK